MVITSPNYAENSSDWFKKRVSHIGRTYQLYYGRWGTMNGLKHGVKNLVLKRNISTAYQNAYYSGRRTVNGES